MVMPIESHPRHISINIINGCGDASLAFVIFKNERRLRCHVIKHFMLTYEWEMVWKEYITDFSIISKVDSQLKDLGCPYKINGGLSEEYLCIGCHKFNKCSSNTAIIELQNLYLIAIKNILNKTLNEPRYAKYIEKGDRVHEIAILNNNRAKIIGSLINNTETYNIKTAHIIEPLWKNVKWKDILKSEVDKIKKQSLPNTIEWCNEETWDISDSINMEETAKLGKRRLKPYDRSSRRINWRKYLQIAYGDEYEHN